MFLSTFTSLMQGAQTHWIMASVGICVYVCLLHDSLKTLAYKKEMSLKEMGMNIVLRRGDGWVFYFHFCAHEFLQPKIDM